MSRPLLCSWQGAPCPSCAEALRYVSERSSDEQRMVYVLLVCPQGHCWEEQLSLQTFRSSLFVQRRPELEPYRPATPPGSPPAARRRLPPV